jgi:hypothetical protein
VAIVLRDVEGTVGVNARPNRRSLPSNRTACETTRIDVEVAWPMLLMIDK